MTTITITALGQHGEGLAEHTGGRLYLPFTHPGDTVTLAADGSLISIDAHASDRTTPFCGHFTFCGGCALQHLSPALYGDFKRGLVEAPLRRAGIETPVAPLLDAQGDGRRRATLHATRAGAGFMAPRSHQLRDLDRCPILTPALAAAPDIARAAQAIAGDCDVGFTATDSGIDVVVRPEKRADPRRLVALGQRFGLARLSLGKELVWQSTVPTVRMGKATVELPPGSFVQATAAAEEVLGDLVLAAVAKSKAVLDLFCGVGPFALRLAERAKVTAADNDSSAIAALQKAVRNTQGLKPVTAVSRDLFRNPYAPAELSGFDAAVLDPPRAGAEAQVRELARTKLRTIAYVSCDPKTFARDAAILVAAAWRLESVTPVDQFAYSTHVEIVGVFQR